MVDAQLMQDGGVHVVDVDWILDNVGSTEKGIRAIRSWLDRNEETILS